MSRKRLLTPRERGLIKGAIRRVYRQTDTFKQVLTKARVELPPALKKDGTPGARNQVRFTCAMCGELFPQKFIQIDHKDPVVYLWMKEEEMTWDEIVYGIFCDMANLQPLCSTPLKLLPKGKESCHRRKTAHENFLRSKWEEFWKNDIVIREKDAYGRPIVTDSEIAIKTAEFEALYQEYLDKKKKEAEEKERKKLEKAQKRMKRGPT